MTSFLRAAAVLLAAALSACGGGGSNANPVDPNVDTNVDPVITGEPVTTVEAGQFYLFAPTASDADGDTLTFSVDNAPSWAGFDDTTGTLSGTPSEAYVGTYDNIVFAVSDGLGGIDSLPAFSITVTSAAVEPANADPVITGSPITVIEAGQLYSFVPTARDANGDALTFTVSNAPSWAGFDSATGSLSGTPSDSDIDTYENIVIAVDDGRGGTDSLAPFSITVTSANIDPANADPVIGGNPATAVEAGQLYVFAPIASDPDGDTLTFTVTNAPSWVSFDTTTGTLSGVPSDTDVGTYGGIVITVSDGRGGVASLPPFSITVTRANAAPVIEGNPVTAIEAGQPYVFAPTASDPDDDTLTFSVTNPPSWAAFDNTTGTLSGTPSDTDVGTYADIAIAVDDGRGGTDSLPAFSITVEQANADPVIAGNPLTVVEAGQPYAFAPTASDPDDDTLTFAVTNPPSWAGFDSTTGALSGTPSDADIGINGDIVIAVSDGRGGTDSLPAFSITVERANADPVIAGDPVTVVEAGQLYSFVPTASDPDGDALTFTVTNAPSWAVFDSATGSLSGTPSDTDVGTQENIVIAVSDGYGGTASLPAFAIIVLQEDPITGQVDTQDARDVAVAGGYAYVADYTAGLQVVDVSDPANPLTVGGLDTSGWAYHVAVADGYVYLADGPSGLQVVDVNDPSNPVIVANVAVPVWTFAAAVANGYVYLADSDTVRVVDVSDPTNPVQAGSLSIGGAGRDMAIAGGYVYIVASSGLQVVDVRDPANPVLAGNADMPGAALGVMVAGGYAYVADGHAGLQVIDVMDPASPAMVASLDLPGRAESVTVVGNRAYVADQVGLQVVDVSDPVNPVLTGSADTPGTAQGVTVADGYAYVADDYTGLQVVTLDSVNPAARAWPVATADTPGFAAAAAVSDGYAYVADGDTTGLQVVDARDPANPVVVGGVGTPDTTNDVAVANGYAYVADNDTGLQLIDVSVPANPVLAARADTPGWAMGVTVSAGYAYVADESSGLQVVDISDSTNPAIVGSVDTPDYAMGVTLSGSYAYVADGRGFQVVDVRDPANPQIVGGVGALEDTRGVAFAGGYAYLADGERGGLRVVDVSDPANPVLAGSVETPGEARAVAVVGVYAYVADGESGIRVVDVRDPASPVIVGRMDTPEFASDVTIVGGYAYVADKKSGLHVIDLNAL